MNIRPGDLAIIIGPKVPPENLGAFVRVVEFIWDGYWHVRSLGPPLVGFDGTTGERSLEMEGRIKGYKLKPIRPEGDGVSVSATEQQGCEA